MKTREREKKKKQKCFFAKTVSSRPNGTSLTAVLIRRLKQYLASTGTSGGPLR